MLILSPIYRLFTRQPTIYRRPRKRLSKFPIITSIFIADTLLFNQSFTGRLSHKKRSTQYDSPLTDTVVYTKGTIQGSVTDVSILVSSIDDYSLVSNYSTSQSIVPSQSLTANFIFTRTITDTLSLTHSITFTHNDYIQSQHVLTLSQTITRSIIHTQSLTHTLSFSQTLTPIDTITRSFTDPITLTDSLIVSLIRPRSLNHLLGVTDVFSTNINHYISITQPLPIPSSLSLQSRFLRTISHSVPLNDSNQHLRQVPIIINQTLSPTQSIIHNRNQTFLIEDRIRLRDTLITIYSHYISIIQPLHLLQTLAYPPWQETSQFIDLSQTLAYNLLVHTRVLQLSDFLLPAPDIINIYPRNNNYLPYNFPYATIRLDRVTPIYSTLMFLEFTLNLPLSTRQHLNDYILSHDPSPYTLIINNRDLWSGHIINNEIRRRKFTDGIVPIYFEAEYIGKLEND